MILEFYLWYCTLNYFEKYFTPTTLRTGKSSTFRKIEEWVECVCSVAENHSGWGGGRFYRTLFWVLPKQNVSINNWPRAAFGHHWIFFYVWSGVCFLNWKVTRRFACFWQARMERQMKIYSSTELCLNRDCVGLNLSWIVYQMIIDIDIL